MNYTQMKTVQSTDLLKMLAIQNKRQELNLKRANSGWLVTASFSRMAITAFSIARVSPLVRCVLSISIAFINWSLALVGAVTWWVNGAFVAKFPGIVVSGALFGNSVWAGIGVTEVQLLGCATDMVCFVSLPLPGVKCAVVSREWG